MQIKILMLLSSDFMTPTEDWVSTQDKISNSLPYFGLIVPSILVFTKPIILLVPKLKVPVKA